MNGPRTNQFVAPTSFITSISRRREKIERRMVFAISSTDAPRSTTTAIRKTSSITRATLRMRLESFWPSLTDLDAGELLRAEVGGDLPSASWRSPA